MLKDSYRWEFVSIHDYSGPIDDPAYIEGAIFCVIDGQVVFSYEEYDYIDQLWSYIVMGLLEALSGKKYDGCFPDQPVRLLFYLEGENLIVGVRRRRFAFSAKKAVHLLASEAKRVFLDLIRLVPEEKRHWELFVAKSDELLSKI